MTPPGHQSGLLMLISRLPASERERKREVKILKLTISITDRESDFISTFTDNPLQEDTLCMDIYRGYHTNITIYKLGLPHQDLQHESANISANNLLSNIDEGK